MFHYKRLVAAVLLVLIPCCFALAENATPTPAPTPSLVPVVEKTQGQQVTVTWSDGRQARLEISETISGRTKLPMTISENACEPSQRLVCEYNPGLSVATYRLAWTKHSDSTRIGQTVRLGFLPAQQRNDLVESTAWTRIDNFLFPGQFSDAPADQMSCPSWNWLVGRPALPTSVSVPSISTEFMLTNPNTMQNENKTITTAANVAWKKTDSGLLEFESVSNWDSYLPVGVNSIFVGDVMKWNLEKSTNVYCDVGFKVDIGILRVAFSEFVARSMKSPYTPVVFDRQLPKLQDLIGSVLNLQTGVFSSSVVYE
jgi:hypothetical protein